MNKVVTEQPDQPHSRQEWDIDEIMSLFGSYIEDNKTPSLSDCRALMPTMQPKKLQDKVRTIIKQKNRKK